MGRLVWVNGEVFGQSGGRGEGTGKGNQLTRKEGLKGLKDVVSTSRAFNSRRSSREKQE